MRAIPYFDSFINEMLLLEVGESNVPAYDYQLSYEAPMVEIYGFTTDSGVEYEVESNSGNPNPDVNNITQITFSVDGSVETVVNRGELYRVMATVMEITREILMRNPEIDIIAIEPTKNSANDLRRHRLYMKYIMNEWPEAKIKRRGDEIYIKVR